MNEKPPILASLTLIVGGLGGVALTGAEKAPEQQRIPAVFIREEDMPRLGTTDQPFGPPPPDGLGKKDSQPTARTYPVRRDYGKSGRPNNRGRTGPLPVWYR